MDNILTEFQKFSKKKKIGHSKKITLEYFVKNDEDQKIHFAHFLLKIQF